MNKEITEEDFVNLANSCVGKGLLKTGQLNYELAKDVAKQEAIAFAEWYFKTDWAITPKEDNPNYYVNIDTGEEMTLPELYTLYLKDKK